MTEEPIVDNFPADPPAEAPAWDDMLFSEAELALLREALDEPAAAGPPWLPQTLDDVDWLAWKLRGLDAEADAIQERAADRLARVKMTRKQLLERYGDAAQAVIEANLPRKQDGSFKTKTLPLDRVQVGLRKHPGGPKLVNKDDLLHYMQQRRYANEDLGGLLDAVRTTVTHRGEWALTMLELVDPGGDPPRAEILIGPLREYVQSLPPVPDPDTGEARPATIPGVDLVPDEERWWFR